MDRKRTGFGTRSGFELAAIGSAVGLGNIWGVPYKTSANGGAAYLFVYLPPQDVLVGGAAGLLVMWLMVKLMTWIADHPDKDGIVLCIGIVLAVAVALYAGLMPYPEDYDADGKLLVDGCLLCAANVLCVFPVSMVSAASGKSGGLKQNRYNRKAASRDRARGAAFRYIAGILPSFKRRDWCCGKRFKMVY